MPVAKLIRRLDLAPTSPTTFLGGAGERGAGAAKRLFGGLVAAQATVAATRTVTDAEMTLHSLHSYFLRPGRPATDIAYEVSVIKAGRNFHARQVVASQGDDVIFSMQASFTRRTGDVGHARVMPDVPAAESLPNRDQRRGREDWQDMPLDLRECSPADGQVAPPHQDVWMRLNGDLPDDPVLATALFIFATDRVLLSTVRRPIADRAPAGGASLDHSVWLHEPVRFDDWHLFAMESPVAARGRGLAMAQVYRADGGLVASIAQEGTLGP